MQQRFTTPRLQPTQSCRQKAKRTQCCCFKGKWGPLFIFSPSAEKQLINMEVVMAEEGRDAMGLLSLMIGLSECCNGPRCQGWWFTGLPPVGMLLRQPGGVNQSVLPFFCNNLWKEIYIHTRYIYVCIIVFFIPVQASVILHVYCREKGRRATLFQDNLYVRVWVMSWRCVLAKWWMAVTERKARCNFLT